MVWGGGWLGAKGILDFAGGTVVHINAGVAGLVCALMLGKRKGFGETAMKPNNIGYTLIGAAMLWVGWFGFNAGSELAADGVAGSAMMATQIARSEEHPSELQSLMRISYAVFCLTKKKKHNALQTSK